VRTHSHVNLNILQAYRQLVQQYAKDATGKTVSPKLAQAEANAVFKANPLGACMSGVLPRIIGVFFKRVPKFGFLLGISYALGEVSRRLHRASLFCVLRPLTDSLLVYEPSPTSRMSTLAYCRTCMHCSMWYLCFFYFGRNAL
jgi:hypothetical protein